MSADINGNFNREYKFEFHFTEGFSKQKVNIEPSDHKHVELEVTTRFQIGLAHIEVLDLYDGEVVNVGINNTRISQLIKVNSQKKYVIINLVDEDLRIELLDISPGYV